MANSIYEGNLSLEHDWGDVGGDGIYAYSGKQVQTLVRGELKSRVGYFYSFSKNNIINVLIGFINEDKYLSWFDAYKDPQTGVLDPDNLENALKDERVVCYTEQSKGIPDPFYSAKLDNKYNSNRYISVDEKVIIPVRFTSTYNEYDAATGALHVSDTGDIGTLIVQARQDNTIGWDSLTGISKTSMPIIPTPWSTNDEVAGAIQNIDLTNFLTLGSWEVRMMVVSNENNVTKKAESSWITYSVIKTSINVSLKTNWAIAQKDPDKMVLEFEYSGAYVDKYLNIEISGVGSSTNNGEDKKIIIRQLGAGNGRTSVDVTTQNNDTYRINTHGIHNIKYWVNIEQNSDYETAPKYAQIMMATDPNNKTPYIIMGDIKGDSVENQLTNWANENILSYAIYAPTELGTLNTNFPVKLSFKDADGNEYFNDIHVINSNANEIRAINKDISIESDNDIIAPRLYCESNFQGVETQYNLLVTKPFMQFYVSNEGDYAPSKGADFIFNPRVRTNDEIETERIKIYNNATGEVVGEGDLLDPNSKVKWEGVKFNNTDGWIQDNLNRKCLRLLDGQQLTIPYQPFSNKGNAAINCYTIEMSVATRNIVDNTIPLIRICDTYERQDTEGIFINGFELRGNDAYYLFNERKTQDALNKRDVMFQEGEKTHITINVCHYSKSKNDIVSGEIKTTPDASKPGEVVLGQDYHFVKIYVNGVINRVIDYSGNPVSDELQTPSSGSALKRYIILGNTGEYGENGVKKAAADLDVYEIRVYKNTFEKSEKDILKDYIASLSSMDDKKQILEANDILNENTGKIDFNKASLKYNTLLWKPCAYSNKSFVRPSGREFGDTKKTSNVYNIGDLEVRLFKTDSTGNRVLDEVRSGTLTNMFCEGQGTSAMTYYKWNQRYKFGEVIDENKNEVKSLFVPFVEGQDSTDMYPLNDNDPYIGRLDGKLNWASSMQSHKMGSVALYNDCQRHVVGGNYMCFLNNESAFEKVDLEKTGSKYKTAKEAFENACEFTGRSNGYGSCRTCVRQEPFLLFVQPEYKKDEVGNLTNTLVDPIYYGPLTWGASKGDKPTFGYNKNFNKYFVMIEGSDNDKALIMCRVPWDSTHAIQVFEKDGKDMVVADPIYYGSANSENKQWEISMGKDTDEYIGEDWGTGKNLCLQMFKDMVNFAYLHNPHIHAFEGTYDQLRDTPITELNSADFYWVTKSSNTTPIMAQTGQTSRVYDLYRYNNNDIDGAAAWVPAGFYDKDSNTYNALNLQIQLQISNSVLSSNSVSENNDLFIKHRVQRFKNGYKGLNSHPYNYDTEYTNGIGEYVHLKDLQFTLQFLKLIAGTDNWGKNTYIYNTGIFFKQDANGGYDRGSVKYGGLDKFGFFQDDLDTIFEIDNSGQKVKPYYVEEHDVENDDGGIRSYYWNSQNNSLFCLAEQAYSSEMTNTMSQILDAMVALGDSPVNCFEKYYQAKTTADYPINVFNQNAEITYMDGYFRGLNDAGDTHHLFLSQCLGDQCQAEREWQKKRVAYISSYAHWGDFAPGTGGKGLAMRSKGYDFTFELTPHIWLYPVITQGSSDIYYTKGDKNPTGTTGRVKAGETITLQTTNAGFETQVRLKSIDSYRNIGNFARHTADSTFTLSGARITDFIVRGTKELPILFNPSADFTISSESNIDNLRNFEISGPVAGNASILTKKLNLNRLWRLETLDLTATSTSGVILPSNSNIRSIKLPSTIVDLTLIGQTNLNEFNIGGYRALQNIEISNTPFIDTLDFVKKCMAANSKINSLTLLDINWIDVEGDVLDYILKINKCNITGTIVMHEKAKVDFSIKNTLLEKFGNIDSTSNSLYIQYTREDFKGNSAIIQGDTYITKSGYYQYKLSANGNTFVSIDWNINSNEFATIDNKGLLTFIDKPDSNAQREAVVQCTITTSTGNVVNKTKTIYFFEKEAEVGDYVYFDGSLSTPEEYNPSKTVVGVCYYVNGDDRRMMACKVANPKDENSNNITVMWGLSSSYFSGYDGANSNLWPVADSADQYVLGARHGGGNLTGTLSTNDMEDAAIASVTTKADLTSYAYSDAGAQGGFIKIPNGTNLSCGQYNTIHIIEHRNNIITATGLQSSALCAARMPGCDENNVYVYPEYQDLTDTIKNLRNLEQLPQEASLYPAASYCYAYEPQVAPGEELNDKFKIHNWYLPSVSELLHMWKCNAPSPSTGDNAFNGDDKSRFVGLEVCYPLKLTGMWEEPSSWGGSSTGPVYWSSNQSSANNLNTMVHRVQFRASNARFLQADPTSGLQYGTSGGSISRFYVRACAKF